MIAELSACPGLRNLNAHGVWIKETAGHVPGGVHRRATAKISFTADAGVLVRADVTTSCASGQIAGSVIFARVVELDPFHAGCSEHAKHSMTRLVNGSTPL